MEDALIVKKVKNRSLPPTETEFKSGRVLENSLDTVRYYKENDLNLITLYRNIKSNKLFAIILCAYQMHPSATELTIETKELARLLGMSRNNYYQLKKVAESLMFCEKRVPSEIDGGFDFQSMFYSIKTKKRGEISFTIQPEIKALFLKKRPEIGYMSYYLRNFEYLSQTYSLRIYEVLKQFQRHDTENGWLTIRYERLILVLMITKKSYLAKIKGKHALRDFEKYVLKSAQKEINQHTDISFTYERIDSPTGQCELCSYKFKIRPNKKNVVKINSVTPSLEDAAVLEHCPLEDRVNKLTSLFSELSDISKKSLSKIDVPDAQFYRNIELVSELIKSGRKSPSNIGGYLNSAIKEDHAKVSKPTSTHKTSKEKIKKITKTQEQETVKQVKEIAPQAEQVESNTELLKYIKSEFDSYINKRVVIFCRANPEEAFKLMSESNLATIKFPKFDDIEKAIDYFTGNSSAPVCRIFRAKIAKSDKTIHDLKSYSRIELMIDIEEVNGEYIIA